MTDPQNGPESGAPTRKTLTKSVLWTFAGAIVVTVLFVLPAEYGVDPTGLGEKLGLLQFSGAAAPEVDAEPRVVEGTFPVVSPDDPFDFYEPETLGDPFSRTHEGEFRTASMIIELAEFEQVEVKAVMQQGDALVYSWKLLEGDSVYTDFHADPLEADNYPELYWLRYRESETAASSGSLVAPFAGNHGWYWLNIEENPVRIELEVRGYYESVEEIMRSFQ
jgi:hypothetical protein